MEAGTKDDPWALVTAPGSSEYTMYRDGDELVCQVGSTTLKYQVRAIEDLTAWLREQGDWVPLGVPYPFTAGTSPDSASRRPGDLTADAYGADRTGGIVVSAERSALDAGTLWAATSTGRLFVSKNADANGPNVVFTRIDTPIAPNRFISLIVPDRTDANAAFIS